MTVPLPTANPAERTSDRARGRYIALFLASALGAAGAQLLIRPPNMRFIDGQFYEAMALGTWALADPPTPVPEPFADRLLVPMLAGVLARLSGLPAMVVIVSLNMLALLALWLFVARYFERKQVPLPTAIAVAVMPIFCVLASFPTTVDAVFVLLATLAVVSVMEGAWRTSLALTAVELLNRMTFAAYYPFLLLRGLLARRWLYALLLVAAVPAVIVIIDVLKPVETENIHGLSGGVYLAGKLVVNALRNVFGIQIWTNTASWCAPPLVVLDVSHVSALGRIDVIGLCAPDFWRALNTWAHYGLVLGIVPLLMWRCFSPKSLLTSRIENVEQTDLCICFWATAIFFVSAPAFGSSGDVALARMFLYAVPWIVVLVPRLPAETRDNPSPLLPGLSVAGAYAVYGVLLT